MDNMKLRFEWELLAAGVETDARGVATLRESRADRNITV